MLKKIKFWIKKHNSLNHLKDIVTFSKCLLMGGTIIRLEASSMCQLRCPCCPTGVRSTKNEEVGWGCLRFENFKEFVRKNTKIKRIELSNWGEIFLNPDLKKIISYAFKKNIHLTAGNGVNLNNLSESMIKHLVRCEFRQLNVSIDGASDETYAKYRKGGNFNRVIDNIKLINKYKKSYKSKFPKLHWQFIVFGHNEHELPKAKKMAKQLGMDFKSKMNWEPSYSRTKNKEFVHKETSLKVKSQKGKTPIYLKPCNQLWISPQINWDGKLLGCCSNRRVSFGNVFEKGLDACLNSEDYVYTKKMLLGKAMVKKNTACYRCPHFEF